VSRESPLIYLSGWYGYNNSGDDALLTVISNSIMKVAPNAKVMIQTPSSGRLPPLSPSVIVRHPRHWFKGHTFLSKVFAALRSDVLVFGGGSTMADVNEARRRGLACKYYICRAAKLRGIPIVFSALGLGPLETQEGIAKARMMLEMADLVEVRDSTSYELCKKMNISSPVIHGFDPAVLIPELFAHRLRPKGRRRDDVLTVGISLSGSPGTVANREVKQGSKIQNLVDAIKNVASLHPLRIAGVEICGDDMHGDKYLIENLLNKLEHVCEVEFISYCPDPAEMMGRLSLLDGMIAERLHAAIYAYTLGVPFAIVPYHRKCLAFAKDIGLPEMLVLDPNILADQVEQALRSQIADRLACSPRLPVERACRMARSGQNAIGEKIRTLIWGKR
jgi:polysaccharide pyruvyl transferase WcaK-like protein